MEKVIFITPREKDKKPFFKYCIVPMCKNTRRNAPDKVFFHMPRDVNLRKKWCKVMKRNDVSPLSSLHCCEDHFNIEEDTENYIQYKIMALEQGHKMTPRLKKDVVPHIFQCQEKNNKKPPPERKFALKRKRQALVEEALSDYDRKQRETQKICETSQHDISEAGPTNTAQIDCEAAPSISSSNVPSSKDVLKVDKAVQVKIKVHYRSKGVNVNLTAKQNSTSVSTVNSKSSVLSTDYEPDVNSPESRSRLNKDDSDSDIQFKSLMRSVTLTAIEREPKMLLGLPKKSFYLIKKLSETIPLPSIDILITLRKIKLDESFSILALNFGYSQSTISRIFSKSIVAISEKMKELIVWPTTSEIIEKLPNSFRARYANVVSIIDCLEIQIGKPTDAVHESLLSSEFKKCNTLKYLISYTPYGLVNYISDGYSGRTTDVLIVENCGFLDYLSPRKAIMADRGFKNITHLLENKNCTLVRPPTDTKATPATKKDVKQSKQIAALRIHIERVIGRLREFNMLLPHACIDQNLIPVINEVIKVACGIINLQVCK